MKCNPIYLSHKNGIYICEIMPLINNIIFFLLIDQLLNSTVKVSGADPANMVRAAEAEMLWDRSTYSVCVCDAAPERWQMMKYKCSVLYLSWSVWSLDSAWLPSMGFSSSALHIPLPQIFSLYILPLPLLLALSVFPASSLTSCCRHRLVGGWGRDSSHTHIDACTCSLSGSYSQTHTRTLVHTH